MQKALAAILLIATLAVCLGFGQAKIPGKMIEETYTVKTGDTLWSVGEKFIAKNTYSARDVREFQEGIYELNYQTVFLNRESQGWARPKEVFPGDKLQIVYWVKED